jgi:hypothetical protein
MPESEPTGPIELLCGCVCGAGRGADIRRWCQTARQLLRQADRCQFGSPEHEAAGARYAAHYSDPDNLVCRWINPKTRQWEDC